MIAIAGGGLAAQRCVERLRRKGYDGRIVMACDEPHAPYDRPPLSKEYLAGTMSAPPHLRPDGWHADNQVELVLGTAASRLHPDASVLELAGGAWLRYEKLLIATGATPRTLPGSERFENVHVLRTLADATRLRDTLRSGARLVVIGAGFIGQEVAATARKLGADVTLVEAMRAPLAHIVGERIGDWFTRLHRSHGVDVRLQTEIAIDSAAEQWDQVVVGIGVEPATAWLTGTPLHPHTPNGGGPSPIVADHAGRTCIPNVFAAGDCAGSQHWEAAVQQGAGAALAMLGEAPAAPAPSSFWSDLYDIRVNWLGDAHGADDVQIEGDPEANDFAAVYRKDGRVVAGLLVGRPQALPELRKELRNGTDSENR